MDKLYSQVLVQQSSLASFFHTSRREKEKLRKEKKWKEKDSFLPFPLKIGQKDFFPKYFLFFLHFYFQIKKIGKLSFLFFSPFYSLVKYHFFSRQILSNLKFKKLIFPTLIDQSKITHNDALCPQ